MKTLALRRGEVMRVGRAGLLTEPHGVEQDDVLFQAEPFVTERDPDRVDPRRRLGNGHPLLDELPGTLVIILIDVVARDLGRRAAFRVDVVIDARGDHRLGRAAPIRNAHRDVICAIRHIRKCPDSETILT